MKNHEEDLQHRIENDLPVESSADAEAYRHVFSALRQEINFTLPVSFADNVVERVMAEAAQKEASRDRFWFIAGSVFFLLGFVAAVVLVKFRPSVGVFTFFEGYPGLLLFGAIFILILHIVDRKFIRAES